MPRSAKCVLVLVVAGLAAMSARAAPAGAFRLGPAVAAVAGNPADALAALPPEPEEYDPATHCSRVARPGMEALVAWLGRHVRGTSWGTYRCERWGPHEASLHAESRAVDWHLDVGVAEDRAAARGLVELLLAPDRTGLPHALARRMGVDEIIWDCSYWGAGMEEFRPYEPCLNRNGDVRRHVDRTTAHRNHLHIGLSRAGAAGRTSFWQQAR